MLKESTPSRLQKGFVAVPEEPDIESLAGEPVKAIKDAEKEAKKLEVELLETFINTLHVTPVIWNKED